MKSTLLKNYLVARRCLCTYLLLIAASDAPPCAALDELAAQEGDGRWVTKAAVLIETLHSLADDDSQAMPPTSFADLRSSFAQNKHWPRTGERVLPGNTADGALWHLWLLTGMPPPEQRPKEPEHDYLRRCAHSYRQYVDKHAELSEEAVHRGGLHNAINSIGSSLWYMTLKYLQEKTGLKHEWIIDVRTTPTSILVRCPLDESVYRELTVAMSRWMEMNESQMAWNDSVRRFRPASGEYLGTDRLLAVIAAGMERKGDRSQGIGDQGRDGGGEGGGDAEREDEGAE